MVMALLGVLLGLVLFGLGVFAGIMAEKREKGKPEEPYAYLTDDGKFYSVEKAMEHMSRKRGDD